MLPSTTARHGVHPAMILGVHIEPLIRGRRVAILGDATIDLADLLVDRGARLVHAYDPDPARAAEALARSAADRASLGHDTGAARHAAGARAHYAAFEGDLGVRDGAFDVVVIPDLSLFNDPADLLRRARRLVPSSGAVVVASPNTEVKSRLLGGSSAGGALGLAAPAALAPHAPFAAGKPGAALGYYELFDVVSLQFPVVRMIGQAPFVGYTVADFALAGEPSVNIDTSLLDVTEQPEWFIAIGSERPVPLEEFAVIELPLADLGTIARSFGVGAAADEADSDSAAEDRLAFIEARARLAVVTTELESMRERHRIEAREAETREKATAAMSARLVELEAELEARDARLKETQLRAGDAHVRAERLTHQITDLEEEVRRQRDRATKLAKQLDDEKKARTKADMELAMIRNKPEIAGAKDRLQDLGTELDAARARIAELEGDVLRALQAQATAPPHRSPIPEIAVVAPDVALVSRVSELEISLQEARHALGDSSRRGAELSAHAAEADTRAALADERATLVEKRAAQAAERTISLEQRCAELLSRADALEVRVADLLRERDDAERALAPDLEAAEGLLRERGRKIAALERDLRESERIGKELVDELSALRDTLEAPPSAADFVVPPPTVVDREVVQDLRGRLNALATRSAKSEADLQAASWRIAQLERDLAEAQAPLPDPSAALHDLEHALSAAQAEIASLRQGAPTELAASEPIRE